MVCCTTSEWQLSGYESELMNAREVPIAAREGFRGTGSNAAGAARGDGGYIFFERPVSGVNLHLHEVRIGSCG